MKEGDKRNSHEISEIQTIYRSSNNASHPAPKKKHPVTKNRRTK
jgi:hypothetical protein